MSKPATSPPASSAATLLELGLEAYGRSDFAGALELLGRAESYARQQQTWNVQAQALIAQGKVKRDLADLEGAGKCVDQALDLARQHQCSALEADALNQRAGINHLAGEYAFALRDLAQALEIARQQGDDRRIANTLINMGILSTKLADYPRALESFKEAHHLICEHLQDPTAQAQCLINLGLLYQETGEDKKALETSELLLQVLSRVENPSLEAISRVNLGNLHKRMGQMELALECFSQALALAQKLKFVKVEIAALDGLGQVRASYGEVEAAIEFHTQALERSREIGDFEAEIAALLNLGRDHLLAEPVRAIEPLTKALHRAQSAEARKAMFEAHELLAQAFEQLGDAPTALMHFRHFHQLQQQVFNQENQQKTRQLSIQFDLERARHDAEVYRLRTVIERQAREQAEATVRERTRELQLSNHTIEHQRQELEQQVIKLHQLLDQNDALRQRVMLAATRSTALNERFLRRLSAELHDGPAQDLAFAMINLDSGELSAVAQKLPAKQREKYSTQLEAISGAIGRALGEIRAICSGMILPELSHRDLSEVVARVISNHKRRTHSEVALSVEGTLDDASLPVKITVYRLVQESLTNAFKHGGGQGQAVHLYNKEGNLHLEVRDQGPGFELEDFLEYTGRLGLVGMRERVESLGGTFWIETAPGQGTCVNAVLSLQSKG